MTQRRTDRRMPRRKSLVKSMLSAAIAFASFHVLTAAGLDADAPVPRSAAPAAQADGGGATAEKPAAKQVTANVGPAASYSARLRLQYDYRKLGDDEDNDLYGYFYGGARNLQGGRVDLYTSARVKSDLDSKSSDMSDDPFHSVDESDGATENRLLQLYADVHDVARRYALRGGRQYVDIADYLHLDGAQVLLLENEEIGGRIYGGRPVSYYRSISDDYAAGVSLVGRPWTGNRSRFTLARYHDGEEDENDQNYYLDVRQELSDNSRARGQVSLLNDDFRMGRLDWFYYTPDGETDLSLGGSYWGSFDAKTRAYSPLYDVLGEQDPYYYTYARLTQQIVPHWLLSPGVSFRIAEEEGSAYNNRDYQNYDVTLIYQPTRAFSASAGLDYWAVEEGDSFVGVSGELRYRHGRVWELSGGASFAQYTYDTYSDISYSSGGGQTTITESGTVIEETPFVRTYFVRGKWRLTKHLALRGQFDVEDDDGEEDLGYRARGAVEVRL